MSAQPEVFIDTDMGLGTPVSDVDDAFAVALLLAAERRNECKVVGVAATFGNVPLSEALPNASALLRALDREDVPLVSGVDGPLLQDIRKLRDLQRELADPSFTSYRRPVSERVIREDVVEFLPRLLRSTPRPIQILALGPLTDLALVLIRDRSLRERIDRIVLMGGTAATGGNITTTAELSVWLDPEAAAIVVRSGIPLVMVGLDVTRRRPVLPADLAAWAAAPAASPLRYLAEGSLHWITCCQRLGVEFYVHDAVAAAYLLRPDLFSAIDVHLDVALQEPARGQTVVNFDRDEPANARVCLDLDADAVFGFIIARIAEVFGAAPCG